MSEPDTRAVTASAASGEPTELARARRPVAPALRGSDDGPTEVVLQRSATQPTADTALWMALRNRSEALDFNRYQAFIDRLLCAETDQGHAAAAPVNNNNGGGASSDDFGSPSIQRRLRELKSRPSIFGVDPFRLLRTATEAFVLFESGLVVQPARFAASGLYEHQPDPLQQPLPVDLLTELVPGEPERSGQALTFAEAQDLLTEYLSTEIGSVGGLGLPYLKRIAQALLPAASLREASPFCEAVMRRRFSAPLAIELCHSYYLELGGLWQTMSLVAMRFQNRRSHARDPLASLSTDTLRGLGSLLWGYVQNEPQNLSVLRRAEEYLYEYGFQLQGRATAGLDVVESRSKFAECFHGLLSSTMDFYVQDASSVVESDGFRMLTGLNDLHLLLNEGFNNQSAELTYTARVESLIVMYLLGRREMTEFLRGRSMVPYPQRWMQSVDAMKSLQGWPLSSVANYGHLSFTGEQIMLSARLADWSDPALTQDNARNWARYHKPAIQRYVHALRAVTGVDLAAPTTRLSAPDARYGGLPATAVPEPLWRNR